MSKNLILLVTISAWAFSSCHKFSERKERFSGDVVTVHGNPVPNARLSFGYAAGGKNAIQWNLQAFTDNNGHYEVDAKIYRKATIEEASVNSDSGRFYNANVDYKGLTRIVVR